MAVMTAQLRWDCMGEFISDRVAGDDAVFAGLSKAQFLAAVNAVDDWVVANSTSFNNSIPQPQRGALSTSQKARLLKLVVTYRYVNGS